MFSNFQAIAKVVENLENTNRDRYYVQLAEAATGGVL